MKKIILVSNTSWSIYNFRLGLINRLKNDGYKVLAVAPRDEHTPKLKENGVDLIELKLKRGLAPFSDLFLIFQLIKIYKKERPEVVIHYTAKPNVFGAWAAKLCDVEKIISVTTGLGYIFIGGNFLLRLIAQLIYKIAFRFTTVNVFQNSDDMYKFIEMKLVNQEKSFLIKGSGVDVDYFSSKHCSVQKNDKFGFLMISRVLKDKGVREYIEAAKILKNKNIEAQFNLIGSIDKDNPAAISKKELDKTKEFLNYLGTFEDIRSYICEADVVVLPSYREGTARVLLEAMSMEKPIITTDVAGCRGLVKDNGILVRPKDADDLANAMIKMINFNQKERMEMGKNGRRMILEEFDEKLIVDQYVGLIEKS